MNPNPTTRATANAACTPDAARKLLDDIKLDAKVDAFLASEKGVAWKASFVEQLTSEAVTCESLDLLAAFQAELAECKDVWDVVRLLFKYARRFSIENLRFHRLLERSKKLVWTASAGLPPEYEEPLRSRGVVKDCRFLSPEERDTLWCFKLGMPTLFRVNPDAPARLAPEYPPQGLPTLQINEEQCAALKHVKGPVWVDFPIPLGPSRNEELAPGVPMANWRGKLSCNVSPDEPVREGFGERMAAFWRLVKAAAPYFVAFAPSRRTVAHAPAVRTSRKYRADTEYEATHGDFELAALAPCVAQHLRRYARQPGAFDGGRTNVAMAHGMVRDIRAGYPSLSSLVTNSLGVARAIPSGPHFPSVRLTGGLMRRKPGDCELRAEPADLGRLPRFAVAVVGASGIAAAGSGTPLLYTYTGETKAVKSTLIDLTQDLITPILSPRWGRIGDDHFLDIERGHRTLRNLYILTVYPHENRRDFPTVRKQALRFQEDLIEGLKNFRDNCPWEVEFDYGAACFSDGGHPTLREVDHALRAKAARAVCVDDDGWVPLRPLHELINPKSRPDIRLLICVKVALQKRRRSAPGTELITAQYDDDAGY